MQTTTLLLALTLSLSPVAQAQAKQPTTTYHQARQPAECKPSTPNRGAGRRDYRVRLEQNKPCKP
jgi:hypothetical protein